MGVKGVSSKKMGFVEKWGGVLVVERVFSDKRVWIWGLD